MTGDQYELAAITEGAEAAGSVPQGAALVGLVEAVLSGDETARQRASRDIRENLGDAALVDACATFASFNAVVKIADGTGIPLEAEKEAATRDIRAQLSIDELENE